MKIYVGIDPGKTGAIAILHLDEVNFIEPQDLERDPSLIDFIEVFVAIEKAQAMPKQGVVSMFHYGVSYGTMIGILKALRKPYQEISPRTWKKEFSLIRQPKDASRQRAIQLFPQVTEQLKLKKYHHRADALLLCCYAKRHNM